jgi:ABC-type transporter Mla maintaining outer membrane lipid asymmetry ATPase subunit MlaF
MIMLYGGYVKADNTPEFFKTTTDPIIRQFIDGISDLKI